MKFDIVVLSKLLKRKIQWNLTLDYACFWCSAWCSSCNVLKRSAENMESLSINFKKVMKSLLFGGLYGTVDLCWYRKQNDRTWCRLSFWLWTRAIKSVLSYWSCYIRRYSSLTVKVRLKNKTVDLTPLFLWRWGQWWKSCFCLPW